MRFQMIKLRNSTQGPVRTPLLTAIQAVPFFRQTRTRFHCFFFDIHHCLVFTIVVLTSVLRDGSINFSCAVRSDFSPVDEHGSKVSMYPHRLRCAAGLILLQARQMGMDAAAIAALFGLTEDEVRKILRTAQTV